MSWGASHRIYVLKNIRVLWQIVIRHFDIWHTVMATNEVIQEYGVKFTNLFSSSLAVEQHKLERFSIGNIFLRVASELT